MKERFTKSRHIQRARMEAMYAAMDPTKNKAGHELICAADKKERAITDKKGRDSVSNFVEVSKKIPEIERLEDPTKTEDREWHTDKWVILKKPIEGRRMLGLEIKSSDPEVKFVKNSADFKKFHPFILIINSRKGRPHRTIINDFKSELERVSQNLREVRFNK